MELNMIYILICLMCLCAESCTCLTKQEKKAIIDAERVIDDVCDIEPGCKMSGCEGGGCGRGKGRDKRHIPLSISGNFTPGSK